MKKVIIGVKNQKSEFIEIFNERVENSMITNEIQNEMTSEKRKDMLKNKELLSQEARKDFTDKISAIGHQFVTQKMKWCYLYI